MKHFWLCLSNIYSHWSVTADSLKNLFPKDCVRNSLNTTFVAFHPPNFLILWDLWTHPSSICKDCFHSFLSLLNILTGIAKCRHYLISNGNRFNVLRGDRPVFLSASVGYMRRGGRGLEDISFITSTQLPCNVIVSISFARCDLEGACSWKQIFSFHFSAVILFAFAQTQLQHFIQKRLVIDWHQAIESVFVLVPKVLSLRLYWAIVWMIVSYFGKLLYFFPYGKMDGVFLLLHCGICPV